MPVAHAQSVDALLDALVEKGILSVKEANNLRQQSDEGFRKALQTQNGMPEWVTQLKVYGDVRGRYEFFKTDNTEPNLVSPVAFDQQNKDRTRFRYRLRFGATATLKDNFEAGFRLMSGDGVGSFGGNTLSGNSTFQDNGSKKGIYVDLAYGKWTPIHLGPWTAGITVGKMENPFLNSDMVWDPDYTPEGAALQGGYAINANHTLKWSGATFILDEINQGSAASNDPIFYGAQLRYDAKWTPKLSTSVGIGWYALSEEENLGNAAVENLNAGNTRYRITDPNNPRFVSGNLVYNYDPVVVDAAISYSLASFPLYPGAFPIRLAGEYLYNPGAPRRNEGMWGGVFFGKSGKKGTWEASWRYERLEEDAWYEEFVNDDFGAYYALSPGGVATGPATSTSPASGFGPGYRGGTGVEGHIVKVVYSVSDGFSIGATWYYTQLVHEQKDPDGRLHDSGQHRVQVDATWKF